MEKHKSPWGESGQTKYLFCLLVKKIENNKTRHIIIIHQMFLLND